jgi:acetyl esterase/lipase
MTPKRIVSYKTLGRHHLKLAVYQPLHLPASKTVILLHGGGWRYGNYLQTGEWPQHLTERGIAVVSVQYRLASSATPTWDKAPSDVSDAVTYLEKHAAELGVPASNLTIMGQSAGGHLALLEAYKNSRVNSVVALYAPVDPVLDYRTSRDKSAELDLIGGPPGQYPDRYKQLSPLTYLSPASPRTLLIQGKSDDLVDVKNAIVASDALKANRVDHELLILPLTGHSFENQHGGFATQLATEKVLRFLNK